MVNCFLFCFTLFSRTENDIPTSSSFQFSNLALLSFTLLLSLRLDSGADVELLTDPFLHFHLFTTSAFSFGANEANLA